MYLETVSVIIEFKKKKQRKQRNTPKNHISFSFPKRNKKRFLYLKLILVTPLNF